jgi:hypothetical protein
VGEQHPGMKVRGFPKTTGWWNGPTPCLMNDPKRVED